MLFDLFRVACVIVNINSVLFVCSLRFINNLSAIKGGVFLGWTSTKLRFLFLLKDTTQWHRWGSNPRSLGLESRTLPLSHINIVTSPTNIIQYIAQSEIGIWKKKSIIVVQTLQEIPTLGSNVQWETWQASFPTETVGPRVGIFLSPLNNDGFYLSHIPVPARGKDKKRTAARRRKLAAQRSVTPLNWRHHVATQRIQDFLEAFFKYKMDLSILTELICKW